MDPNYERDRKAWGELHPIHQERLRKAICLLAKVHNRKLADDAVLVWCMALAPYGAGEAVYAALRMSCEDDRMPSIGTVKRRIQGRPELEMYKAPPPLTEAEQKRADQAAIMSMLYLVYVHDWEPADFSGEVFKRVFNRLDADPETCLNAAKEAFDKPTVLKWMESRQ